MEKIANNLMQMRKSKGLSKDQLSKILKIPMLYIDDYENCKKEVPISVMIKYSKYFKTSIDSICGMLELPEMKFARIRPEREAMENKLNELNSVLLSRGMDLHKLSEKELHNIVYLCKLSQKGRFTKEQFEIVLSIMKIVELYSFNRKNVEGLIELLNMGAFNIKEVLNKDEFLDVIRDIREVV
ncbi:helix-turn-helix domain-containing protein [Clostridium botulinum]|uniref:Helix-turn-helix XRE-family protein n=1 Tax=Clostridium botulinum TaxID=1491 RepID=A0A126JHU9_CLOBO|nr:helix-turn-helix domain-containing protein [Clostridium botulinum]ALT05321.1 Helix-turn-helix XRE-family protein [Clostridium botulinum]NFH90520.1 helix-turn-helix domain-containing protein [Clostridium botulinum]NFI19536.1 helix-turn-helix domain-containing protein [Clostridium botulinum]NFN06140.1 helix-turn-helix domain-containing protein [Clostridium botulinum]NFN19463.1 helix-turn-helix domain-containing protein [Clostridium botulinum]